MRRFVLSADGRATRAAAFAVLVLLAGGGTADAAPVPPTIRDASLAVTIGTALPPIAVTQSATVTPLVSRNISKQLTGLVIPTPPPVVNTASQIIPVTDPGSAPIKGIMATAANGPGAFAGVPDAGWGGQMPLVGVNKVCLFGSCTAAVSNLIVPISVVGEGAAAFVTAAVNLTVIGAPWTTMTAAIGTLTVMGGITQMTGMVGSASLTTDTVQLVTPVFVSTSIGPSAIVPVMGIFNFTIPEPATFAALGASIAALVSVGVARRRKS